MALRVVDAAGPSSTEPGVNSAALAPAANSCLACGQRGGKLLLCGRCQNVWFCNRECQIVARKELGHKGANCSAGGALRSASSAAQPQPSASMDVEELSRNYLDLIDEAERAQLINTRIGYLAAVNKLKEAALLADQMGGVPRAEHSAHANQLLSSVLVRLGNKTAAAQAACSGLRAARASGNMTMLIKGLTSCGDVARNASSEMASAERESREQERLSVSPSLDLSQEGRISLPTTPAAISRLSLAYNEAAVGTCDAALATVGGRGSPADADYRRVPSLSVEADARGCLATCLWNMDKELQRSLVLLRQAVALRRQAVRTAGPGRNTLNAQGLLADQLSNLGFLQTLCSDGVAEAEACLREALALGEGLGDVLLTGKTLRRLVNLGCEAHAAVGPAEAEAFRSRLNQLLVQMGRSVETSCSICLEPLAPPADGAAEDAAGGGGSDGAGVGLNSCVRVLECEHQFHHGCLSTWHSASDRVCPLCNK